MLQDHNNSPRAKSISKTPTPYTPPQVVELDQLARGVGAICSPSGNGAIPDCQNGTVANGQRRLVYCWYRCKPITPV